MPRNCLLEFSTAAENTRWSLLRLSLSRCPRSAHCIDQSFAYSFPKPAATLAALMHCSASEGSAWTADSGIRWSEKRSRADAGALSGFFVVAGLGGLAGGADTDCRPPTARIFPVSQESSAGLPLVASRSSACRSRDRKSSSWTLLASSLSSRRTGIVGVPASPAKARCVSTTVFWREAGWAVLAARILRHPRIGAASTASLDLVKI